MGLPVVRRCQARSSPVIVIPVIVIVVIIIVVVVIVVIVIVVIVVIAIIIVVIIIVVIIIVVIVIVVIVVIVIGIVVIVAIVTVVIIISLMWCTYGRQSLHHVKGVSPTNTKTMMATPAPWKRPQHMCIKDALILLFEYKTRNNWKRNTFLLCTFLQFCTKWFAKCSF